MQRGSKCSCCIASVTWEHQLLQDGVSLSWSADPGRFLEVNHFCRDACVGGCYQEFHYVYPSEILLETVGSQKSYWWRNGAFFCLTLSQSCAAYFHPCSYLVLLCAGTFFWPLFFSLMKVILAQTSPVWMYGIGVCEYVVEGIMHLGVRRHQIYLSQHAQGCPKVS